MKKVVLFLSTLICLLIGSTRQIQAIYDPTIVANNRFGIHLGSPADLEEAASLINSSGGDWGYVTFVIQKGERNTNHWQKVFDKARRLHLIPIVRIATKGNGVNWEKPSFGDIDGWISFLNSLNWVIKNRYVVIGNEPNHAKEWGGEVNPEEYATYLKIFSEKLKKSSADFFILPAGLDASAANSKETMDESLFIRRMIEKEKGIFEYFDGWTSHSYPNPSFSASEYASGKGSIKTYEWEINYLKSLGLKKDLPIFITETGWIHNGSGNSFKQLKTENIGQRLTNAYKFIWNNKNIAAVTPFILNYPEPPFNVFSWKDKSGSFYSFYYDVQKLAKIKGEPIQEINGLIISILIPPLQQIGQNFSGIVLVKNTGQSIWENNQIQIRSKEKEGIKILSTSFNQIEPGNEGFIFIKAISPEKTGISIGNLELSINNQSLGNAYSYHIFVISPIKVNFEAIFDKIISVFKGLTQKF